MSTQVPFLLFSCTTFCRIFSVGVTFQKKLTHRKITSRFVVEGGSLSRGGLLAVSGGMGRQNDGGGFGR